MHIYTRYHIDGRVEKYPAAQSEWELEQYQAAVGGYIEAVPAKLWPAPLALHHARQSQEVIAYCDEEGRLKGLPPNPSFPGIVGPVLVHQKEELL